jgi:non-canonical (house-cleaning) NTP pyrophosphatase
MDDELSLTVLLGTTSPLKLNACKEAFKSGTVIKTLSHYTSAVPEQPIGREQTQLGAMERAKAALKELLESDVNATHVAVGIENGIYQDDEKRWLDAACIVFIVHYRHDDDRILIAWSDAVVVPDNNLKAMATFDGSVHWSSLKDPHRLIEPFLSRQHYLVACMQQLIEQLKL